MFRVQFGGWDWQEEWPVNNPVGIGHHVRLTTGKLGPGLCGRSGGIRLTRFVRPKVSIASYVCSACSSTLGHGVDVPHAAQKFIGDLVRVLNQGHRHTECGIALVAASHRFEMLTSPLTQAGNGLKTPVRASRCSPIWPAPNLGPSTVVVADTCTDRLPNPKNTIVECRLRRPTLHDRISNGYIPSLWRVKYVGDG